MHLPIQLHGALVSSHSTNSTIPERGNCFVCNPISDTIILIQFIVLVLALLIILLHVWPQASKSESQKSREQDPKDTNIVWHVFGLITILWLLAFLIHAIIKFNIDPDASDGDDFKGPSLRHRKSWAQFINLGTMNVLAIAVALLTLVVVVEA